MLNLTALTGRLTRDLELRKTDAGVPVTSFSIAVQRNYKSGGDYPVDFIDCVAWRGTAEFISKYFKKGSMITVVGNLETRKFTDKEGNNRKAVEVIVKDAYFGDSAKKEGGNDGEQETPGSYGGYGNFEPDFGAEDDGGSDLPFSGGFPPFNG